MYATLRTRGGGAAGAQRWRLLLLRNHSSTQVLLRGGNRASSLVAAQGPLAATVIGINPSTRNQQKLTFSSSAVVEVVSSDESKSIIDCWRTNGHHHLSKHRLNMNLQHHLLYPLVGVRYYTTDNRDGRGKGRNENSSNTTTSMSRPHRPNFDRDVLQRAARGELAASRGKNKHSSGIPRLAARTAHRPNLRPPAAGARAGRLVAMSRAQDRQQRGGIAAFDEVGDDDDEETATVQGFRLDEEEEEDDDEDNEWRPSSGPPTGSRGGGGRGPPPPQQKQSLDDLFENDDYHAFELMDDNKYYWREEEQEKLVTANSEFDESLLYDEDGNFVVEYTEEDLEFKPLLEKSNARTRLAQDRIGFLAQARGAGGGDSDDDNGNDDRGHDDDDSDDPENWDLKQELIDPEDRFFYDNNDIFEICQRDDGDVYDPIKPEDEAFYNTCLPLAPHEPGLDGFLQAMHEHPTKYATATFENLHPGSKREPKPLFFKKTRHQPPVEWVESHKRFLYVTGLPPLTVNGEPGNMSNAIHRSFLQQSIAKLVVGVDDYSTQVCVANRRSAFVGFASPRLLARALKAGPQEPHLKEVPMISLYQPAASQSAATGDATDQKEEDAKFMAFIATRPDCIARLTNIPPGNSSGSVARNLFPRGTKVGDVYGTSLTSDDVYFMAKTSILVRFASPEQAQSAVTSALVWKRLEEWGTYPVQFFRARRELVHAGFGEISKDEEIRVMGPRLIVDGDMPSRQFHISHGGTILLRNLDATATTDVSSSSWQSSLKKDLTALFQPFCARRRDGNRSIEFVTCQAGRFTGHAYIGFDEPGEAEACINECHGRMKFGDRTLGMKLVHDRIVPHQPLFKPEKRPARSEHELLDDLNNWEKYIDAADIEYLQKHGVSKLVIDEALRGIRRSNPTFGALDAGLRSEALEPSMERGQQYKELVQMYVATLKECIATPDDVGAMYEALHFPDEPIDLSVFDKWNARLKDIERVRTAN
jgi:hypothetical protein